MTSRGSIVVDTRLLIPRSRVQVEQLFLAPKGRKGAKNVKKKLLKSVTLIDGPILVRFIVYNVQNVGSSHRHLRKID